MNPFITINARQLGAGQQLAGPGVQACHLLVLNEDCCQHPGRSLIGSSLGGIVLGCDTQHNTCVSHSPMTLYWSNIDDLQ